jgi:hypothetical protein
VFDAETSALAAQIIEETDVEPRRGHRHLTGFVGDWCAEE